MDRALKGLAVVLFLCAGLWLLVKATRKAETVHETSAPMQAVNQGDSKSVKFQEGERAISAIPPIKLIRERKTVKRTDPPVPAPSENK